MRFSLLYKATGGGGRNAEDTPPSSFPSRHEFFRHANLPSRDHRPFPSRSDGQSPAVVDHVGNLLDGASLLSLSSALPSSFDTMPLRGPQYFITWGCAEIDGEASFRLPWGLQMIPGLVLSAGMWVLCHSLRTQVDADLFINRLWFPESPRWFVSSPFRLLIGRLTCTFVWQARRP